MAARLAALGPRALVLAGTLLVLSTGGITYAAEQQLATAPATPAATTPAGPVTLVVPDVRREAFVFAKGSLEDAGFAWRVTGSVHGFAANVVTAQSPAPGTRVVDTGSPVVTLTLKRNAKYKQLGEPDDVSSYRGTAVRLATAAAPKAPALAATTPTATTAAPAPASTTAAKPAAKTPAPAKKTYPQQRPVAFEVAGAPKEPLNEMPLPDRARALERWLADKPKPTNPNVTHWMIQNEWIVTGARFGWWRGEEALKILLETDRRVFALWGIGEKSQARVEAALAYVEARSR